ncbi:exopolysaccharide biosynthesis protein, WecB/TagA/CpsF family [Rivularia sp. PCC 7116]|uniref:WecB/TagA/CpsF family glycosyltransferase n=1 Tax=Rivularia sp. PCC 7116 TaxID=373994 RepID=UPI00029F0739|nr:WecB/TagA/CpsF family glycosyltransferase [Rivularia sp. PCC 7116]AFY54579.1 exopolysaccharide biosynthesis protein, WecB/TagA/CpsF family [Rivularia sp. PCC 7116]
MKQVKIFNLDIHNLTMSELLEKLRFGGVVFTPNLDHLMKIQKNYQFYLTYKKADYVVCDSKVLMYAFKFLGTPIQEKISGSDLFPAFYNYYKHDKQVKIFLLGGVGETAKIAKQKINAKVGRDIVVSTYSPPFGFENDEQECQHIIELINSSGANVLAIGVGAPKQELWLYQFKHQLKNVKTFFAIGATINFEAGHVKRAPKWMSEIGLEWLYRLLSEPQRLWKRYLLDDLPFFWLVLKQKFRLYKNPWTQVWKYQNNLNSNQLTNAKNEILDLKRQSTR